MASPYWMKTLINRTFSQRFFMSRLSHFPIIGKLIDKALFEDDDILYLPQDKAIQVNRSIQQPDDTVIPSRILEHFIQEANYHWIMNFCICRDSSACKDYPVDLGCLFLGEAAMGINPEFGRPVSREEALDHAARCREAGLVHLIGRNKLDTVWLNVGPGKKLLTVCNCCPCCCLWRVLPVITPRIARKVSRLPGLQVRVTEKCVGCGTCTRAICFVDAIRVEENRAVISDDCRGCGRCITVCPTGAIEIHIDSPQLVDRAIDRISAVVDVH